MPISLADRLRRLLPLHSSQRRVLLGIAEGATLKSHRYVNGEKVYRLHRLGGRVEIVPIRVIRSLIRRGYLQSNQKFPAATLLLSAEGERVAARLLGREDVDPLSGGRFRTDQRE